MKTKLTMREQEILAELATGPDNHAEIAQRLGMSQHAVNAHLSNMCEKTGAQNQVQLLRWVIGQAIIIESAQTVLMKALQKEQP